MKKNSFRLLFAGTCLALLIKFYWPHHSGQQQRLITTPRKAEQRLLQGKEKVISKKAVGIFFKRCNSGMQNAALERLALELLHCQTCKKESLWDNQHFENERGIFRLRVFKDDGANGSYKKTLLYKEDANGFPQILKLKPSQTIKNLLRESKLLYHGFAMRMTASSNRQLIVKIIDNQLVYLELSGPQGEQLFSCDKSQ